MVAEPASDSGTSPDITKAVAKTETRILDTATRMTKRDGTGCLTVRRNKRADVKARQNPTNMEKMGDVNANRRLILVLAAIQAVAKSATETAFA